MELPQGKMELTFNEMPELLKKMDEIGGALWSVTEMLQNLRVEMNQTNKELKEIRNKGIPTWVKI